MTYMNVQQSYLCFFVRFLPKRGLLISQFSFLEYIVTYFEIKQENRYGIVKNTQKQRCSFCTFDKCQPVDIFEEHMVLFY
mgnify:FL=1